jgi:hypothetical protein
MVGGCRPGQGDSKKSKGNVRGAGCGGAGLITYLRRGNHIATCRSCGAEGDARHRHSAFPCGQGEP